MSAPPPVRGLRAAFVFLTRLPVGGFPYRDDDWRWAPAYFPVVGALLGALAGAVDRALLPLGEWAAALGALAASMLLTGAFHEDGLADTSDALGGGFDREKVLLILKDSRVGAFGACALVVSIAGRAALLARLGSDVAWAMPLIGASARVGPVWQLAVLPYVSSPGSKSRGVARAGAVQACVATASTLALAAGLLVTHHLAVARAAATVAACAAVTVLTGWRYVRRLGGVTGDFLGATEQLGELAGYAALAWGVA